MCYSVDSLGHDTTGSEGFCIDFVSYTTKISQNVGYDQSNGARPSRKRVTGWDLVPTASVADKPGEHNGQKDGQGAGGARSGEKR